MIIWIDGTYGVGKSHLAQRLYEHITNSIFLQSDYYYDVWKKELDNNGDPTKIFIGGFSAQTNIYFLDYFADIIIKNLKEDYVQIIDMCLLCDKSKDKLYKKVLSKTDQSIHLILTADKQTIEKRCKEQENREIGFALDGYVTNTKYIMNYPDAEIIKTDNKSEKEVFEICMQLIQESGMK